MIIAEYQREDDHRIRRQRRERNVDTTEAPVISCKVRSVCGDQRSGGEIQEQECLGVRPWVVGHGGMRYGNHRREVSSPE